MKTIYLIIIIIFVTFSTIYADSMITNKILETKHPVSLTTLEVGSKSRIVSYEGWIKDRRWQTGHPSRPLELEFLDSHRGHQEITVWINRKVSVISNTGEAIDDSEVQEIYNLSVQKNGGWHKDGLIPGKWIGRHKSLDDCKSEFDENYRSEVDSLKVRFKKITTDDLKANLPE
ncbi:MAG: hypothetical protein HQK65_00250 [Desulfamplus sp.]|nr:hypothetical protein [Desulfamplus sp.]